MKPSRVLLFKRISAIVFLVKLVSFCKYETISGRIFSVSSTDLERFCVSSVVIPPCDIFKVAFVSLITEVLKNLLPKKFPTKLLVMIISLILTIGFVLLFGGVSVINGIYGAVGSFIVSFVSMYGWDSFKELYNRFKYEKENSGGGE